MKVEKWGIDRRNDNLIIIFEHGFRGEPYRLMDREPINYGCYENPKPDYVIKGKINGQRVVLNVWEKYHWYTKTVL